MTATSGNSIRAECTRDGRERHTRAQDHGSEFTRSWFAARVSHDECRSPAVNDQQPAAAQVLL